MAAGLCLRPAQPSNATSASVSVQISKVLHPSPASPAANRDWLGQATAQLEALGVWEKRTQ